MTRPRTSAEWEFHHRRMQSRFLNAIALLNKRGRSEQAAIVHKKYHQWIDRNLTG